MGQSVENKVALVTGVNRGNGKLIVESFLRARAKIFSGGRESGFSQAARIRMRR